MGQLFMVNPPKGRKSRKRKKKRTAAQKAATKRMIAARKKSLAGSKPQKRKKGATTMARKRKKRATAVRRKRRSTAKRRSPVTTLRRGSVYMTNPRKRRRRRSAGGSYRRNPAGIFKQIQQGAMDAGATLVGGAVARMATGLLPLPNTGITGAASGLAVAVGIGMIARRVVSPDTARFITAGAMQVPIKNLITTFIPQAGAFLGDYDNVGAYQLNNGEGAGVGDYLQSGGMAAYGREEPVVEIGSY